MAIGPTVARAAHARLPLAHAAALALLAGLAGGCTSGDAVPPRPDEISGRVITVLCDADMTWTAFADGALGTRPAGTADALTVVSLPIAPPPDQQAQAWQTTVRQVPVSNSALGPPVALAVSRDGFTAYACETRGPAPAGATRLDDLPPGAVVTAIDIRNPAAPAVLGTAQVGREPTSCDVHPAGGFLAIVTRDDATPLAIIALEPGGALGAARTWPLLQSQAEGEKSPRATCVAWHPGGRHLAVTLPDRHQVAFYEFTPDKGDGTPGLAPWGAPVTVGRHPLTGRFTPDGRYFVTADVQWGADVPGFMAAPPAGTLSLVELSRVDSALTDDGEIDAARVIHRVVDRVEVGVSPESMAISPDGRFIVTGNLRGSFLAEGSPHATAGGSLSLVALNPDSGTLAACGEYPLRAMPEGVAFDAKGRHVVVSEFRSFSRGAAATRGELSFFKLIAGESPALVKGDFYLGVGVGPHGVVIVR